MAIAVSNYDIDIPATVALSWGAVTTVADTDGVPKTLIVGDDVGNVGIEVQVAGENVDNASWTSFYAGVGDARVDTQSTFRFIRARRTITDGGTVSVRLLCQPQPTGATGPTGPTGPTGATGATGPTGPAGPAGSVNYYHKTSPLVAGVATFVFVDIVNPTAGFWVSREAVNASTGIGVELTCVGAYAAGELTIEVTSILANTNTETNDISDVTCHVIDAPSTP